jgi:hypothetical protein
LAEIQGIKPNENIWWNLGSTRISGGARLGGAFMKDEDIQLEDVRSLALDFGDFVAAVGGKYTPKN